MNLRTSLQCLAIAVICLLQVEAKVQKECDCVCSKLSSNYIKQLEELTNRVASLEEDNRQLSSAQVQNPKESCEAFRERCPNADQGAPGKQRQAKGPGLEEQSRLIRTKRSKEQKEKLGSKEPPKSHEVLGTCGVTFDLKTRLAAKPENARMGEWPWMVPILKYNNKSGESFPICRAFLIDNRHLLSAAACFEDDRASLYMTRIGQVNFTQLGDTYPLSKISFHPKYKKGEYYNDIVLLTLGKEVDIPNFNPVCLPPRDDDFFQNLTGRDSLLIGWNWVTDWTLEQAPVSVVPNDECEEVYDSDFSSNRLPDGMTSEMICSSSTEGSSCAGGYGAPLMIKFQNRWYAVGVANHYRDCETPRIYAKLSEYMDWIDEQRANLALLKE